MCSVSSVKPVGFAGGPASKLTTKRRARELGAKRHRAGPERRLIDEQFAGQSAGPHAVAVEHVGEPLVFGRVALPSVGEDHAPGGARGGEAW
jgi:hypothetical protein